MIRDLVGPDDPALHRRATEVVPLDHWIFKDLWETMVARRGVGLAAPQLGMSIRAAVVWVGERALILCDPTVRPCGMRMVAAVEECLSLPGLKVKVARPASIYLKSHPGAATQVVSRSLVARAVQHEYDHLEGKLITAYQR